MKPIFLKSLSQYFDIFTTSALTLGTRNKKVIGMVLVSGEFIIYSRNETRTS